MFKEGNTRIILVRHGECRGNIENRFRGRKDYPLNSTGLKQAEDLAENVSSLKPDKIISSPLTRAKQTARAIAEKLGNDFETLDGFNNISLGSWEGRLKTEIEMEFPDMWNTWMNYPEELKIDDGETLHQTQKRALDSLNQVVEENRGKTILIVSHRTTLKPLIAACIGINAPYFWKIHIDTASYSILDHNENTGYCLFQLNQTHFLKDLNIEWN